MDGSIDCLINEKMDVDGEMTTDKSTEVWVEA